MLENWKVGKHPSQIVSDVKVQNTNFPCPPNRRESEGSEVEYYGGYMICESVANDAHANLIAAAPRMKMFIKEIFLKIEAEQKKQNGTCLVGFNCSDVSLIKEILESTT